MLGRKLRLSLDHYTTHTHTTHTHVHFRLLKLFPTRKQNTTWRWNLHLLTSLTESQKDLEAHGCKLKATTYPIIPPYTKYTNHRHYLLHNIFWMCQWVTSERGCSIALPTISINTYATRKKMSKPKHYEPSRSSCEKSCSKEEGKGGVY